jgi:hypothetical protein
MQNIVIEKPYRFVPPHRGRFWHALFGFYLPRYLSRCHGIESVECRGAEHLQRSLAAGPDPARALHDGRVYRGRHGLAGRRFCRENFPGVRPRPGRSDATKTERGSRRRLKWARLRRFPAGNWLRFHTQLPQ